MTDLAGPADLSAAAAAKMLGAISHRGPDGERTAQLGRVTFAFNRLSFIDLEGGMQPISNEDGTVYMICNGEIFNHPELRRGLELLGHVFRTKTDVEVILHLYEEYGDDFPKRLNGQFAIALYDKKKEKLILVRDGMGISPLFWAKIGGAVVFASECKAILQYPGAPRKLNLKALDQLMNFPGVVSPETFFDGIKALRPGHELIISDGSVTEREYWDLAFPGEEEDKGAEYYAETLRELIKKSISRRLAADVPVGFYVSGGLDSSVVACFIGKYLLDSYYSFSAEIGAGELDESAFQGIVRDAVRSEHYSVKVDDGAIIDRLPDVVYQAESAVKESYDVAAFMLSELVHRTPAKAVLTGQGSDEIFFGYVGYMVDLFRNMRKDTMTKEELVINERLWGDPYFRYERDHAALRAVHGEIYSRELMAAIGGFSALNESPVDVGRLRGLSDGKRRSYIDCKLRLGDHLLGEHGDRMFFAHSVEGRHPFLDPELISFALTVPDKYKLNGTNEKYILKKAAEGIVPDAILKRKKFPFQAPGAASLLKNGGNGLIDGSLIKKYGIFDPKKIEELRKIYAAPGFRLMGAYEIDYLMIAATTTVLCEKYRLSV
ncbi:MAG: asparagine synthase (glutamine-hydrolyzing) [Clostridia bacterium]|nr:asparagine synthase (glutamine-hydrolyzing) [Clostridia bacterium]